MAVFSVGCYHAWQIKSDGFTAMARKKTPWLPPIGVLAETCAQRMVVEAIGRSGLPVRLAVKR